MEDYNKTINELMARRLQNEKTIAKQIQNLGGQLAAMEPSQLSKTPIEAQHQQAQSLAAAAVDHSNKIKQIDGLVSQIEDLDSEIQQIKVEIRNKNRVMQTHYEALGFAAYRAYNAYRKDSKNVESFEGLFDKPDKLEKEMSQIQNELNTRKAKEQSAIKRVLNGGRAYFLQGLLKMNSLRKPAVYRNTGKQVSISDFYTLVNDESLNNEIKPVVAIQESVGRLLKKEDLLIEKKIKITDEIEKLGGKMGVINPTKNMLMSIEEAEKQLVNLHTLIGQNYIDESLNNVITSEEIDRIYSAIRSLEDQNQRLDRQLHRLRAAIEVGRLEKQIKSAHDRIGHLTNDIQTRNDEIESMNRSITELEERKKKKKRYVVRRPHFSANDHWTIPMRRRPDKNEATCRRPQKRILGQLSVSILSRHFGVNTRIVNKV